MRAAHQGRGITDAHFDRVAAHLSATLASLGVADTLIGEVIDAIAPLRAEITDGPPFREGRVEGGANPD